MCPECNGHIITIEEKGETVCSQCGLIIDERKLDLSHNEMRAFTKEEINKKMRTGAPISSLTPDIGLCTYMDKSRIYQPDLRRAAKRNTYMSWKNRNILIAITELKRLSHNLNLPDNVKKAALNLYREAFKRNILKGRSINGMVAACIHYECKRNNIPRIIQDILNETQINLKTLKFCFRTLVKTLNLKIPILDPIALIPQFTTKLGLGFDIEKFTINILQSHLNKGILNGKNPIGLCAAAIYLASKFKNIKIRQKEICKIVGVTEVTLRARYKEIIENMDLIVNQ